MYFILYLLNVFSILKESWILIVLVHEINSPQFDIVLIPRQPVFAFTP